MKRLFWALLLMAVVAGIYVLLPHVAAVAQNTQDLSVSSPSGGYGIALVTINTFTPPLPSGVTANYAEISGTCQFSGTPQDPPGTTGVATCTITRRSSLDGFFSGGPFPFTYKITATSEFLLFLPPDIEPLHGRVLEHGNVLLFDGTTRTNPSFVITHGVAARL